MALRDLVTTSALPSPSISATISAPVGGEATRNGPSRVPLAVPHHTSTPEIERIDRDIGVPIMVKISGGESCDSGIHRERPRRFKRAVAFIEKYSQILVSHDIDKPITVHISDGKVLNG